MKYTQELTKPIKRKRLGLLADEALHAEEARRIVDEMFAKIPMLAQAHGVDHGDWFGLALALAKEHVPGFKVVNPSGRPPEWSDVDKAEFSIAVDEVRLSSGKTVDESMKLVIRLERWAKKTAPMSLEALRQHYYQADKRWIAVVKDARAYELLMAGKETH